MRSGLTTKLKKLPGSPGVYLYKNSKGKIIYVGKAAVLRNRVRQYFQKSRNLDTKTDLLVADIADLDWLVVDSEIEALFLESELIKRYKPKYNIELRDDKHYEYVRIDLASPHPTVQIVRQPLDDGAVYIGPFVEGIRKALKYLRHIFPYDTKVAPKTGSKLLADIGLSPGLEAGRTSPAEYRKTLKLLIKYLNGNNKTLLAQLTKEMKSMAKSNEYEKAARLRDQISSLKRLNSQIIFSDRELFDITKDQALDGLKKLLGLNSPLRRIEGYDISHMSGTNNVASQVVFIDGVADKRSYRKYKMRRPGNDDFAHMREVLTRRFTGRGLSSQSLPDLLLIDGGKGQVGAALQALADLSIRIPLIGLAKRYETIILPTGNNLEEVVLASDSPIIKLLQRVRDESHRFAVSYHTSLKIRGQTASRLDEIEGIGPVTRRKLVRHFGSLRAVEVADEQELKDLLGEKRGSQLFGRLKTK